MVRNPDRGASSPFAHLESINEDNEMLSSLGGKEIQRKLSWAGTSRCCKLERRNGIWEEGNGPPEAVLPEMDQPKEVFLAKKMTSSSLSNPFLYSHATCHAPPHELIFMAPIESKVKHVIFVNRVCRKSLPLRRRNCWPWL